VSHDPRPDLIAALVESIDERTEAQSDAVTAALVRASWPGGVCDRLEPPALEWVRRWGPARVVGRLLEDCSCADGRCAVCN
jgi:hypothetical protein